MLSSEGTIIRGAAGSGLCADAMTEADRNAEVGEGPSCEGL